MFFLFCPHPSTRNSKETLGSHFLFHPISLTSQRLTQQITSACHFLLLISPLGCAILSGLTAWLWLHVLDPTRKAMQPMPQSASHACFSQVLPYILHSQSLSRHATPYQRQEESSPEASPPKVQLQLSTSPPIAEVLQLLWQWGGTPFHPTEKDRHVKTFHHQTA